jgi:protein-tyrosine phosphatase
LDTAIDDETLSSMTMSPASPDPLLDRDDRSDGPTSDPTGPHRLVPFEAVRNFRDLGGYESRFGGAVRWGSVYRSAALHEMTVDDLRRFDQLGIVTVFDLRSALEFEEHPDPMPAINVPVLGRFMSQSEPPDFASMIDHDEGVAFMSQMCMNMLDYGNLEIGTVLGSLADRGELPAVFHCTAGKDRTGIVAALLLEVLGVDRADVLDDFELTERYRGPQQDSTAFQRMVGFGMPPEAAAGALGAPRRMMGDVLDALDERYGGVERYLVGRADMTPTSIDDLRRNLLV